MPPEDLTKIYQRLARKPAPVTTSPTLAPPTPAPTPTSTPPPVLVESLSVPLWAATNFINVITKLGGLAVGLTALSYLLGYFKLWAYLVGLGAVWAITSYPAITIAQEGTWMLVFIGVGFLWCVYSLTQTDDPPMNFRRREFVISIIGGLLSFLPLAHFSFITPAFALKLGTYGSYIMFIAVGIICGSATAQMVYDKRTWGRYTLWQIAAALVMLYQVGPVQLGRRNAEVDGKPLTTELPIVTIKEDDTNTKWRLVQVMDKGALVILPSENVSERRFRIIPLVNIDDITAN